MGIRNYLIEGVSGTGKTSVCKELQRRGYHAINGDRELAYQGDPETGIRMDGAAHENHIWHVDKVTGNVAQVFLTDREWKETLYAVYKSLRPGGRFVFEVRDPNAQAWQRWTKENTYRCIMVPSYGNVEGWVEVTNVENSFVSFRWTYIFESDGALFTSDSTLRFRSRQEIVNSLLEVGLSVDEVREAPDCPGLEFVFVASRTV